MMAFSIYRLYEFHMQSLYRIASINWQNRVACIMAHVTCSGHLRKERKSIYIAPFIYYVYLKALSQRSHSFTCKYTMPAFPSYAFTRWRHL